MTSALTRSSRTDSGGAGCCCGGEAFTGTGQTEDCCVNPVPKKLYCTITSDECPGLAQTIEMNWGADPLASFNGGDAWYGEGTVLSGALCDTPVTYKVWLWCCAAPNWCFAASGFNAVCQIGFHPVGGVSGLATCPSVGVGFNFLVTTSIETNCCVCTSTGTGGVSFVTFDITQ
jgi:hypothetical protein